MADEPEPLPSSWTADEPSEPTGGRRRRGLLLLAGAVALLLAAGVVTLLIRDNPLDPDERAWPAELSGRPTGLGEQDQTAAEVDAVAPPGVYLWNGFDGWHLWVVSGDGVDGVTVTLETHGDEFEHISLSNRDVGTLDAEERTATLEVPAGSPVTGIDFEPGFYSEGLTIDVEGSDGPIEPTLLRLGPAGGADTLPLRIDKPEVG